MAGREAAPLFRVSISTISKALIRRRTTGETVARAPHCHVPAKLAGHEEALRAETERRPDATTSELRAFFAETYGVQPTG